MKIHEQINGDELTVFLEGSLDESTSFVVESELDKILSRGMEVVVLDMQEVKYISSIGIRVLMLAYKRSIKLGKKITVTNVSGKAREILETVGIFPLFCGK